MIGNFFSFFKYNPHSWYPIKLPLQSLFKLHKVSQEETLDQSHSEGGRLEVIIKDELPLEARNLKTNSETFFLFF